MSVLLRIAKRAKQNKIVAFLWRQPPINYMVAGAIIMIAAYVTLFIITALSNALLFSGYAADGAFQMLNPLRRLAAGQAIGADFNNFHGIGVPLMHLPFYLLFGQGLFASELTRWLLSPALFMLAVFGFFYAYKRNKKLAIVAAAIITAIAMTTMSLFVLPFTSMLGVRSVMPVLLAMLMFGQKRFKKPLSKKYTWLAWMSWYELLVGATMVLCFACGTEFGVAAILAFFITYLLYRVDDNTWRTRLFSALRIFGVFAAGLLVAFSIITRGHPLQPLHYSLIDIPNDQFWYFGIPPNSFLYLGNIVQTFWQDSDLHTYWWYAVLAIGCIVWVHRLKEYRTQTQVFLYALLAGAFAMVSMLGYYHNSEAFALARMSLLIIGVSVCILWGHYAKNLKIVVNLQTHGKKLKLGPNHLLAVLAAVMIIGFVGQSYNVLAGAVQDYDIKKIARKTKAYVTGQDTNNLDDTWNQDDSILMPLIQADNNMPIADITTGDFTHGVNSKIAQIIVDPGAHASFMHPGQIVYFNRAGRQIVGSVQKYGANNLLVTLQNKKAELKPQYDGAPHVVIVAEDFKHDNTKLWSTYSTLFEDEMHTFSATSQGADYIIHALGPELRAQYISDFAKVQPKYVVTLQKSYFIYEEWLQNASWDFYSLLNANYEAVRDGNMHVLWVRRNQPWVDPLAQNQQGWQNMTINADAKTIAVPTPDWSKLPDVNAYINEQFQKQADRVKANGDDVQVSLLLSADDYVRNQAAHTAENLQQNQPRFEGQGHNTTNPSFLTVQPPKSSIPHADLARPNRAVILVKLQYQITNPLGSLPLLGKTPRFLVQENNLFTRTPVSLPPYEHEVIFPIVVSELNHDSSLTLKTYSLLPGNVSAKIVSAQWQQLDASAANLKELTDWPGPDLRAP